MKQKEFDTNCDKDVKELFSFLNEDIISIKKEKELITLCNKDGSNSSMSAECFVLKINWNGSTEIKRPVDLIGKIGWFWDNGRKSVKQLEILEEEDSMYGFSSECGLTCDNFSLLTMNEAKKLIGKIGWFTDESLHGDVFGILEKKVGNHFKPTICWCLDSYDSFRPLTLAEIKKLVKPLKGE